MKKLQIKKNKGFTLIELLIVVGMLAMLSATIYGVYNKVNGSTKINSTIDLSVNILQKITEASTVAENYENFGSETSYGVSNGAFSSASNQLSNELLKSGIFPEGSINDGYVINSYGNKVGLYFSKTPNLFYMSHTNLESGDCVKIVQQVQNYADSVIVQSSGGGALVKDLSGNFDREKLETECFSTQKNNVIFIKSKEK